MFKLGLRIEIALTSTSEILIECVRNAYSNFLEPICLHENKAETQMETFQMKLSSSTIMWEGREGLSNVLWAGIRARQSQGWPGGLLTPDI